MVAPRRPDSPAAGRSVRRGPRGRRGFTLLELIIAVSILTVLVGAAVPVTSKVLTHRARKATTEQIHHLSIAAGAFFRDVGRLPDNIRELLIDPGSASAPGWSGPYLPGVVADQLTGLTGYEVDAWSRTYRMQSSQSRLVIQSRGEDSVWNSGDDILIELDVTPIRRELTLERLRILNHAVALYNQLYQVTEPLPANYPVVYRALVSRGLLPQDDDFLYDGWGQTFVADPPGQAPVVRLTSRSFLPAQEGPRNNYGGQLQRRPLEAGAGQLRRRDLGLGP
jgi:prepilin-type N-terminal cleavage/methylation domain-containing protein